MMLGLMARAAVLEPLRAAVTVKDCRYRVVL